MLNDRVTTSRPPTSAYLGAGAMLALALAFPIALMVLNPTLMFERGWEQYLGTTLYITAIGMLAVELRRSWRNERAFTEPQDWKTNPNAADPRLLPRRVRLLLSGGEVAQRLELNREASGLDQEQAAGRFTLTRYVLYLLPVIGFIGTVEGISKALMNISRVLPMVKDLDGFLGNLTSVTSALQIAFDSTLLALFLSAALMLVQTLVYRRAEDLLARVDRWVVEHVVPTAGSVATEIDGLGPQVERLAAAIDRLAPALVCLERGAQSIGRVGDDLEALVQAGEVLRKGVATLSRIEAALVAGSGPDEQLDQIRRGVDRSAGAIEGLAGQWSAAFERSSRLTQEQLARTLSSLKDALDMLNVSMEQGNVLYRNIVKKMLPVYHGPDERDLAA